MVSYNTIGSPMLLVSHTPPKPAKIVLVVTGPAKHAIVRRALEGPVGPPVPASFLQAAEGDVTVVVDRSAWGDV